MKDCKKWLKIDVILKIIKKIIEVFKKIVNNFKIKELDDGLTDDLVYWGIINGYWKINVWIDSRGIVGIKMALCHSGPPTLNILIQFKNSVHYNNNLFNKQAIKILHNS